MAVNRFPQYAGRPHVVYRAYDDADRLLYIGCTLDFERRQAEHRWHRPWADRIARWETTEYPDQASALAAEEQAIASERPEFNAMYNGAGLTGWNDERRQSDTCLHGHPWGENAVINAQGVRICVTCKRIATWRYDAKRGRQYAIRKLAELGEQVAS
jgi:predicted GIY-YIG superfamily endonuclease